MTESKLSSIQNLPYKRDDHIFHTKSAPQNRIHQSIMVLNIVHQITQHENTLIEDTAKIKQE
jgi:hypothetical protein